MNNQEYLTRSLKTFGLQTEDIELILFKAQIDPNAYATDMQLLDEAMYQHLPLMIASLSNVSEGGYSVSWNFEGLKLFYSSLAISLGKPDAFNKKPTVIAKNIW
jgi:hypothetical protein